MRVLRNEASKRLLGNGYCGRPRELDFQYETICESCSMLFTTIEYRTPSRPSAVMPPNTATTVAATSTTPYSSSSTTPRLTPITHIT